MTNLKNKILVIDDEPDILMIIRTVLEEYIPELDTAVSVDDATRLIRGNSYDMIISDYFLGDGTVEEIYEILQSQQHVPPIVVISGMFDQVATDSLDSLNIKHKFSKPLNLVEFSDKIHQIFSEAINREIELKAS